MSHPSTLLPLPPQTAKIRNKGERGHSLLTSLVPYAVPFNPFHLSSPFIFCFWYLSFSPLSSTAPTSPNSLNPNSSS